MHSNIYTFIVAPVLGWLAIVSLLVVAYLTTLEIAERRKNRRLEKKRAEINSQGLSRFPVAKRAAFRTRLTPLVSSSNCLKSGQVFPRIDRHTGFDFRAADLN